MGWPLAVSAALMERRRGALFRALAALAVGHFAAMIGILLPFALMTMLVQWQVEIRVVAALVVIALGLYLLINRRHPRFLARIPPSRLALWSFLVALAHGAALMLVPIYLGLCGTAAQSTGHIAANTLMTRAAGLSLLVALVHTAAMILSGGIIAFAVHHWLGVRFLSKGWFNLDVVWASSLIAVGAISLGALWL
ncbi:hypothetical protein [Profundibacter sp.]|uniref:hypothetical protein n=1 Tax=Profundibacter sp. TaxID=3101071 RepID=UPI003D0BD47F